MITIVDYGLGNIQAFLNAYRRLNIPVRTARTPEELADSGKVILPGVGAFDHAMDQLEDSGMRPALQDLVLSRGVPLLGVCVGMQMLARSSEEGAASGLGWVDGRVRSLPPRDFTLPLPHMGWNDVRPNAENELFRGLEADAKFYFLHSYHFECENSADVAATSTYGVSFCCSLRSGNIYGVQFHPEKSHHFGTRLLRNFAEL